MADEKYQVLRMQLMERLISNETLAAAGGSCVSVLSVVLGAANPKDEKLAAGGSCVSVLSVVLGAEMQDFDTKR